MVRFFSISSVNIRKSLRGCEPRFQKKDLHKYGSKDTFII